jgi:glyoxylase-like metal-dependent hydrolase (beta-lactamase superfamily II)
MTRLSRRTFALSMPALGAAPVLVTDLRPALAASAPPVTAWPTAQVKVGRFTVTALADGFADMPFSYFVGRDPAEIERAAGALFAARPGGIRLVFNQFLIEDGSQRILVDTGPGGVFANSGQLPRSLAAIGVGLDSIDAVIVTHMHVDHIGGLIAGGRRAYPNAEIYVDRRDVLHWTDSAKRAGAPDYLINSFDAASDVVRLYPTLQAFNAPREIARGISIIDLTGHTPGHVGVRIADDGQVLLMVSDLLFHPSIHPVTTDIGFLFEQDRPAAEAMRARFYPRAIEEKALIAATHMPFPGLGHIVSDGGRPRWLAAEWAYQS